MESFPITDRALITKRSPKQTLYDKMLFIIYIISVITTITTHTTPGCLPTLDRSVHDAHETHRRITSLNMLKGSSASMNIPGRVEK